MASVAEPEEMAGFVKLEGLPVPIAEGGRAAAGAGAPVSLSSALVSLGEGRKGLLRGTFCSISVEQMPAAQTSHPSAESSAEPSALLDIWGTKHSALVIFAQALNPWK